MGRFSPIEGTVTSIADFPFGCLHLASHCPDNIWGDLFCRHRSPYVCAEPGTDPAGRQNHRLLRFAGAYASHLPASVSGCGGGKTNQESICHAGHL